MALQWQAFRKIVEIKNKRTGPTQSKTLLHTGVTGLLLLVHLLLQYLLLSKMLLGHLLLGTICYCVIIATIVQILLRTLKFSKVIYDHNQFRQLRKLIESVR